MKKIICILIAILIIAACFAGCKKAEEKPSETNKPSLTEALESKVNPSESEEAPSDVVVTEEPTPESEVVPESTEVHSDHVITDNAIIGKWHAEYDITPMINNGLSSGDMVGEVIDAKIEAPLPLEIEFEFEENGSYFVKGVFEESKIDVFIEDFSRVLVDYICKSNGVTMEQLDEVAKEQGYESGLAYVKETMTESMYDALIEGVSEDMNNNGEYTFDGKTLVMKPTNGSDSTMLIEFNGNDVMLMDISEEEKEDFEIKDLFPLSLTRIQ